MTYFPLIDPSTGKTYRQLNLEKQHNIPLETLVELENGARLFVVEHIRDCDSTPLYVLAIDKNQRLYRNESENFYDSKVFIGYREDDLEVIH